MLWVWLRLVLLLPPAVLAAECLRQLHSDVPASGVVESPGFPSPYEANVDCLFNLTTLSSNVIHLTFLHFDLAPPRENGDQCLDAYLLIVVVDRQGKQHVGSRICGSRIPRKIETMQSQIRIQFVVSSAGKRHRGFRIQYDMLSEAAIREPLSKISGLDGETRMTCGGRSQPGQLTGEILSPGYPTTFPRNCSCHWLIRVEPQQRIYIRLVHLNLSPTIVECERASVSIIDGYKHEQPSEKKDLFGDSSEARFCGTEQYYAEDGMKSFLSSGNRILVRFVTTDGPIINPNQTESFGFKIIWTAVDSIVGEENTEACSQFACRSGHICIDQAQGVCASRSQLCIDQSLVCNGVSNCVEGDHSDEQHCYSREIILASAFALGTLFLLGAVCVCCDQWRKKRRLHQMMRASRQNGKVQLGPGSRLPPRPPR